MCQGLESAYCSGEDCVSDCSENGTSGDGEEEKRRQRADLEVDVAIIGKKTMTSSECRVKSELVLTQIYRPPTQAMDHRLYSCLCCSQGIGRTLQEIIRMHHSLLNYSRTAAIGPSSNK